MSSFLPIFQAFRFRDEDPSYIDGPATWIDSQDTDIEIAANDDSTYRIRMRVGETDGKKGDVQGRCEFSYNGGTWTQLTQISGEGIIGVDISGLTHNTDTGSALLTGGSGSFDACGEYNESSSDCNLDELTASNFTEYDFAFALEPGYISSGDYFLLRITNAGTTLGATTARIDVSAAADVYVTPAPAIATASAVLGAVILGSVSITPAAAIAAASAVDPAVILGSISVTPAAAIATAAAIDPGVILGSIVITPAAAASTATAQDPGVILGSTTAIPAAAIAVGSALDPTVIEGGGDVFVTPDPAIAAASAINPGVILGSVVVSPSVATAVAQAVNPGVVLGSIVISPAVAEAIAGAVSPGVVLGSITITPGVASAVASALSPGVILGSITITPALAQAVAAAIDPTVIEGGADVVVTPAAAIALGIAINPVVLVPRREIVIPYVWQDVFAGSVDDVTAQINERGREIERRMGTFPVIRLQDGVPAPATQDYAVIYIDDADGSIKIRFADGTIKTFTVT